MQNIMDNFIPELASCIVSHLDPQEIKSLNLLEILSEKDCKELVLSNFSDIIDDKESRGDFPSWRDFYFYLDHIVNSKARTLEFKTGDLSPIDLRVTKVIIQFNELYAFFYPEKVPLLKTLKEGDIIKLVDCNNFLIVERGDKGLYLRYARQYDPDEFGLRNVRIHNFKPIYNFPTRYWDKEGYENFNLFSLNRGQSKIEKTSEGVISLVFNNVRYKLIFKFDTGRDNFELGMDIRFKTVIPCITFSRNLLSTMLVEAA